MNECITSTYNKDNRRRSKSRSIQLFHPSFILAEPTTGLAFGFCCHSAAAAAVESVAAAGVAGTFGG